MDSAGVPLRKGWGGHQCDLARKEAAPLPVCLPCSASLLAPLASPPRLLLDRVLFSVLWVTSVSPLFSGLYPEGLSLSLGSEDLSTVVVLKLERAHRSPGELIKRGQSVRGGT